jgi:hypothetical protein
MTAVMTAVMTVAVVGCGGESSEGTPAPAPSSPAAAVAAAPAQAPSAAAAANSEAAIAVQPMHSEGSLIRYPRLNGLADAAVQAKVNAIFAAREKQAQEDRDACFDLVRDAGETPTDANFFVKIDVRYVSARYVSLEIRRSYSCAGPYPNDDVPEPLTIDLIAGAEVNWHKIFKTGPGSYNIAKDSSEPLSEAYAARYAIEGGRGAPECKGVIERGFGNMFIRLDARRGVMMQPDLPHVAAVCADEIAFSPDQIAPLVRDARFLADLRATVRK